jgi:hypothetical protein
MTRQSRGEQVSRDWSPARDAGAARSSLATAAYFLFHSQELHEQGSVLIPSVDRRAGQALTDIASRLSELKKTFR